MQFPTNVYLKVFLYLEQMEAIANITTKPVAQGKEITKMNVDHIDP